jgi:predicted O-linked N-acetylglucosamine transferase (SPINDLY family)
VADRVFSRAELGLPQEGVVFCCFNNGYKILPDTFDAWMRVLTAVDGSVLWLFHSNEHGASKLRLAAKARGVDPSRLRFAQFMPQAEHLARLRAADLFLDTAPYNAHTTASDALWAGVPVITWLGESFAARVAGSLLHAVGLPEMVCATQKDMETLAIDLAQTPGRLASVRSRLADGRKASPLFDTAAFTRHLEALYEAMVQRARDGLAPEHLG